MLAKALVCSNGHRNFFLFSSEFTKYARNGKFPEDFIFTADKN